MIQDKFYKADVYAESHRSGALRGPVTAKTNEPFAIDSRDVAFFQMSLEHIEGGSLGAAGGLAYIAHVVDMEVDEFAEVLRRATQDLVGVSPRSTWFGFGWPSPCVVSAQERLADAATFATNLHEPGTG